jgi:long-chain acyl-CoA synthetase
MFEFATQPKPLLQIGPDALSGIELETFVGRKCVDLRGGIGPVVLGARPTAAFVIDLLAAWRADRLVAVIPSDWSATDRAAAVERLGQFDPHPDARLILYTSGSTGRPRGVQLSMANVHANVNAVIQSLALDRATEQTLHLPLSYSFGLLGQLLPALRLGLSTRLLDGFAAVPRHLAEHGMHGVWSGVPTHWVNLLRYLENAREISVDPSHVISAGGRLDVAVRAALRARFPNARLYNNYGLTEASPRVLCLGDDDPAFFSSAVGRPVGDWIVEFDTAGELRARGSQVMLGYLDADDPPRVRDGWLFTGDLGWRDERGVVHITGRADDQVKVAGVRFDLAEVETILVAHPLVHAAAVVARPHETLGHALDAFLVATPELRRSALVTYLSTRLPPAKIPRGFFRIDAVPLVANGKVDRHRLAQTDFPLR